MSQPSVGSLSPSDVPNSPGTLLPTTQLLFGQRSNVQQNQPAYCSHADTRPRPPSLPCDLQGPSAPRLREHVGTHAGGQGREDDALLHAGEANAQVLLPWTPKMRLWTINSLACHVTKWSEDDDKRLHHVMCYVNSPKRKKLVGWGGLGRGGYPLLTHLFALPFSHVFLLGFLSAFVEMSCSPPAGNLLLACFYTSRGSQLKH